MVFDLELLVAFAVFVGAFLDFLAGGSYSAGDEAVSERHTAEGNAPRTPTQSLQKLRWMQHHPLRCLQSCSESTDV